MRPTLFESRESVIHDLADLGVRVSEILPYHPTFGQLKQMRDELSTLYKALEAYPVPHFQVFYLCAAGGFSKQVRDEMK